MNYQEHDPRPRTSPEWGFGALLATRRKGIHVREVRRPPRAYDAETIDGNEYPVLAMPDIVVFPNLVTPLFIGRDRPVWAAEAAEAMGVPLLVVAQRDPELADPELSDLYTIGTSVDIGRVLRMPDGSTTVLVQGVERVRITELIDTDPYLRVRGVPIYEDERHDMASEALMRAVLALFEKVVDLNPNLPDDAYVAAMNEKNPGGLADLLAHLLDLETAKRQELLETLDANARLQKLSIILGQELDVLELEDHIQNQVQQEVDKNQREYYLREQMRAIQTELGEGDETQQEVTELKQKLNKVGLPADVRAKAEKEIGKLAAMPPMSPETTVIRNYVDWLLDVPWTTSTEDNLDIVRAARILEHNHYGLPKVKDRILEHIAVHKLAAEKMKSPILCFVGPPGTGKTSLGKSIAEALGRKFVRMSLGGIHDEAEIRGHRRTYIGSLPGRILQTMHTAGTINPLFMLDEIDKLGIDFRGDPSSALLEVLDPEQNHAFSDHYLEVSYDLSKVLFITTANYLDPIPPALRDRLEVIEFPGYVDSEKIAIAEQFLIPRQLDSHGLTPQGLQLGREALRTIIREYTFEAGVRNLERSIANICRKVARKVAEGKPAPRRITPGLVNKLLGPPEYTEWLANEHDEVGVANGLAWTEAGGDVMQIEVAVMDGKGGLTLTGQLGEVMQEAAQAALTCVRAHVAELGLSEVDFDKIDMHVHVPEAAIPKDGPSAGVTMAVALISALSCRPVRHDIAMTGEVTLRGRVLPIGGLKEKLMAAHRMHLTTVFIPKRNEKDLVDIPREIQRDLNLVLVERLDEILAQVLLEPQQPAPKPKRTRRAPRKKGNETPAETTEILEQSSGG